MGSKKDQRRPLDDGDWLDRVYERVMEKVQDRHKGGNRWKHLRISLGLAAMVLSAVGGASIFAGLTDNSLKLLLGCATLAGGLCGAVGTFLKIDERYFANRTELTAWQELLKRTERLSVELEKAAGDPAKLKTIEEKITEIETACTNLDNQNTLARQGSLNQQDSPSAGQSQSDGASAGTPGASAKA